MCDNCGESNCKCNRVIDRQGIRGPQGPAGPQGPRGAASTVPGPAGPQGPAGTNTKIISEGSVLSNAITGGGYDFIITCNDPSGPYTAGEWGLLGAIAVSTAGSVTVTITFSVNVGAGYVLIQAQTHVTGGSSSVIPLCLPATLAGMVNTNSLKINVQAASGTIIARNTNVTIK